MNNLIDLNSIDAAPAKVSPANNDWIQLNDLKNGNYSFGFWNIKIKNYANGQQVLEFNGICKTNTFDILQSYGFCKRYREDGTFLLIRDIDNTLTKQTPSQIKDFVITLVDGLPEDIDICGFKIRSIKLKEEFLREHRVLFSDDALSPLRNHTKKLLNDTSDTMFFPFKNGVAKVTKKGVAVVPYSDLKDVCIWENHIIKRDFVITDRASMFEDFIRNISNNDDSRINAVKAAIGYLLHRYYSSTCTKAVILYDERLTDSDSAHGGSGKGILAKAIAQLRELVTINGKRFDPTERFNLQNVTESTEAILLDDVLPNFDFEFFNSILTDGYEFEQKNKTTIRIPFEDSPKLIISSNQIIRTKKGETASRRQFIIEVNDYYSAKLATTQTPIIDEHGCEFFRGWNDGQWCEFDNFMLNCCGLFLNNGLPVNINKNVEQNRLLQTTCQEFMQWMDEQKFSTNTEYSFSEYFTDFKLTAFGEVSLFGTKTFNNWMKLHAETKGFNYKSFRYNKITYFRIEDLNSKENENTSIKQIDILPF